MNESEFKKRLKQRGAASADNTDSSPSAHSVHKTETIQLALKAFDEQQQAETTSKNIFQGFIQRLRLTGNKTQKDEASKMKKNKYPWAVGGLAVAGLCGLVLVNNPEIMFDPTSVGDTDILIPERRSPNDVASSDTSTESNQGATLGESEIQEVIVTASRQSNETATLEELSRIVRDASISDSQESRDRFAAVQSQRSTQAQMLAQKSEHLLTPENRDAFSEFDINGIQLVADEPVSTFSIDVDSASYSFVRRSLNNGYLPDPDSVRIEEMINYFNYQYPLPEDTSVPFEPTVTVLPSPWNTGKKLVHIGIQGYDIESDQKPKSNLVLLLDVSGSMNSPDKLPLVKQSMALLLDQLQPSDTVGIVVYAGAAGTVLEPTPVSEKHKILDALNNLEAGGSTAGGEGIRAAYRLAEVNFDEDAVNRIILATDGDFNVGISNTDDLQTYVEDQRNKGVFLSVLGFGQGNYRDELMQALAQNGNGVAAYIDTFGEAQKVLADEATSTLFPIAKDVKIQVEFNPNTVSEYRLVGYETRALAREDFNNDKVDAGDIGSGHRVTAIYEITPAGSEAQSVDPLRYQTEPETASTANASSEYGFLKIRYKLPDEDESRLISEAIAIESKEPVDLTYSVLNQEIQFSIAVAGFAQLLKDDRYLNNWNLEDALELARANKGTDEYGYRAEFINLIRKAQVSAPR